MNLNPVDTLRTSFRDLGEAPHCDTEAREKEKIHETPLWKALTFHDFGLIVAATFTVFAVAIAFFLIMRHATHYSKPYEQKQIIRILVMIPIYAVVSFFSYFYYTHAIYFELVRDCYEAFAIASFFTLMCHYVATNLHEQKDYFRNVQQKNWVWPVDWMQKCSGGEQKGPFRKPRSGLTWFNIIWICIFQYCFIRPFFTFVAVAAQANGRYCQSSLDPRFAYIWVAGFEATSVTIAMYCLIQFYVQLKEDLAPHRPFLKVLCIKLVIFFCFWQSWLISLLTTKDGPLQATDKINGPDLRIGIPSMLTCIEMTIFATLHLWAFPWKPYDLKSGQVQLTAHPDAFSLDHPPTYTHSPAGALISALNPWDIIKACSRGFRWLFVGVRHRKEDPSYQSKMEPLSSSDTAYHHADTAARSEDSDTAGLLDNAQANSYQQSGGAYYGEDRTGCYDGSPEAPTRPQAFRIAV